MLDVLKIREDFPMLKKTMHGKPLIYLDNGATILLTYSNFVSTSCDKS